MKILSKIGIVEVQWLVLVRWLMGWLGWWILGGVFGILGMPRLATILASIIGGLMFLWPWFIGSIDTKTIESQGILKKFQEADKILTQSIKQEVPRSGRGQKPRGPKPKPSGADKPSEQKPEDF